MGNGTFGFNNMSMSAKEWDEGKLLGPFLLEAGLSLMRSGASSDRIRSNIERFASAGNNVLHIAISSLSISINLNDQAGQVLYNGTGSINAQGVNFKIVSGISHLSWEVAEKKVTLEDCKKQLKQICDQPHYNRWLLLLMVSLAGAAFCYAFDGSTPEMFICFGATFFGLFLKQELVKKAFNTYLITYASAVTACVFVGIMHQFLPTLKMEHAFSTCVLFLIPGVPLINSITDLIEGYTLNGVARGVGALMHAIAIAFGLVTTLYIFNYF
jgi:uncharacterized membrane protein YjjP (DUF1212 family)